MPQDALTEMNARLDRYVGELKKDKPRRPTRKPVTLRLAALLVALGGALWIAQWFWLPLNRDVALESGSYVNGYTTGNGVIIFVLGITIEALVMAALFLVTAWGLSIGGIAARATTFIGGSLVILEMAVRLAGARTRWEELCFIGILACCAGAIALLLTPTARHFYDWRVGHARR